MGFHIVDFSSMRALVPVSASARTSASAGARPECVMHQGECCIKLVENTMLSHNVTHVRMRGASEWHRTKAGNMSSSITPGDGIINKHVRG